MTAHAHPANGEDTLDPIQRELEAAREQIDSLTLTLHDVQARLERKHLALLQSRSEGRRAAHQAHDVRSIAPARLHLLAVNELQPHCHLDFIVEGLTPSHPSPASLRFRLVHHLGHPGIAILSPDPSHAPLTAWHTSGSENGVAFMMFMPSDPVGRARMQSLGTSDWRLLERLAAIAHQQLQLGDWHIGRWWVDVAARLRGELDAIPDVLRFESAVVESTRNGPEQLEIQMTRVEFGCREFGDLCLRWSVGDGLRWLRSNDSASVPLSVWTVDAEGQLTPELALPFGSGASIKARLFFWQRLAPLERTLVRALVDALARISSARTPDRDSGDSEHAMSKLKAVVHGLRRQVRMLVAFDDLRHLLGT